MSECNGAPNDYGEASETPAGETPADKVRTDIAELDVSTLGTPDAADRFRLVQSGGAPCTAAGRCPARGPPSPGPAPVPSR